jgi:hypothetical protein
MIIKVISFFALILLLSSTFYYLLLFILSPVFGQEESNNNIILDMERISQNLAKGHLKTISYENQSQNIVNLKKYTLLLIICMSKR